MPQNGATGAGGGSVGTPAPAAAGGTPAPAAPAAAEPDYKALHAAETQKRAALEEKVKAAERERLDRLKADKKRETDEAERRRDPVKHFREVLGEDWYDVATKAKAGTVTPAGVSSALSDSEQRLEAKFAERERVLDAKIAQLQAADEDRARERLYAKASEHAKSDTAKYPFTNKYKKADEVGALIEGHFKATARRNSDGSWEPGEMWTQEQGAAEMEKYWAGVRKMVLESENGREHESAPRLTIVPETGDGTRGEPKDDAERAERVRNAFAAMKARITGKSERAN